MSVIPDPAITDWVPLWAAGMPVSYVPAARVYRSTAQSIPHGALTPISFDGEVHDTDNIHDSANPTRLTCRTAGFYQIEGWANFAQNATGERQLIIVRGGTAWLGNTNVGPTPANDTKCQVSAQMPLNVGEYVELHAYQSSGAALNVQANSNENPVLSMGYLGTGSGVPLGVFQPPGYGTSLPASPLDGQEFTLVDNVTNPSWQWRFRYNAQSTSAYKWEYIGGSEALSRVATDEATTVVATWLDLPTIGPRFFAPRAGEYDVSWSLHGYHTAAPAVLWATTYLNLATSDWGGQNIYLAASSYFFPFPTQAERYTTAANDEIRMRYYNSNAGTAHFAHRWMRVRPVRVS